MEVPRQASGFTIVEVVIAIALFVIVAPTIANMITSVGYINGSSRNYQIVNGLAVQKMESLRGKGYANLANGTTSFSSEIPSTLGSPSSGSYTISDQATNLKKIVVTISYTSQGQSQSYNYTTFVGKNGLGQQSS